MSGPWEDFSANPQDTTRPPWEDFQGGQQSTPPWVDYGGQNASQPTMAETPRRATFGESFGRGVDQLQGTLYGGVEAIGEATGSQTLTEFGREGRERNVVEAKEAAPPKQSFLGIKGVGDFGQWAKETIGEQIPMMAPSVAGGLAGAGAGALTGPFAPVGVPLGAAIGAFIPGFVMGVGEVQGTMKEKNPQAAAGASVFVGGSAIAALDTVIPGRIGSMLVKSLGKEVAEQVAERALTKAVVVEGGKQMAIEGFTEALQEAIGEVSGSVGAGTNVEWDKLPEKMIEAGAAGALLGGFTGGLTGAATRRTPSEGKNPEQEISAGSADTAATFEPSNITVVDEETQANVRNVIEQPIREAQEKQPSPIFFSQLERLIRQKGPNAASAEQWMNSIKNWQSEGIKAEEIEWLKLPDYLKDKAGKVSKADLLTHVQENMIDVSTIERRKVANEQIQWKDNLDGIQPGTPITWTDQYNQYEIVEIRPAPGAWRNSSSYDLYYTDPRGGERQLLDRWSTLDRAQRYAQQHSDRIVEDHSDTKTPRYEDYQLEGPKEDYTELQLIWNSPQMKARDNTTPYDDMVKVLTAKYGAEWYFKLTEEESAALTAAEQAQYIASQNRNKGLYVGGHWSEPNVLAHVRISSRTDAEGKKVLYVDEIQSDWHQTGRKSGYEGGPPAITEEQINDAKQAAIQAKEAFYSAVETHPTLREYPNLVNSLSYARQYSNPRDFLYDYGGFESLRPLADEYRRLQDIAFDLEDRFYANDAMVPNAPFKGTAWGELAVKRILRYAADNGFERVAFTNPEVQSKRWQATPGSDRERGFQEFYGKIIPKIVDKWAKKLGAKTGKTAIYTTERTEPLPPVELVPVVFPSGDPAYVVAPVGRYQAGATVTDETHQDPDADVFSIEGPALRQLEIRQNNAQQKPPSEPALFVDITENAKSKIKEIGFPIMQVGGPSGPPNVTIIGKEDGPLVPAAKKAGEVINQLYKRLGLTKPLRIEIRRGLSGNSLGEMMPEGVPQDDLRAAVNAGQMPLEEARKIWMERAQRGKATSYVIRIWPDRFESPEEMFSTMMHELGHILHFDKYAQAAPEVQLAIQAEYAKWASQNSTPSRSFRELLVSRDTFIKVFYGNRSTLDSGVDMEMSSMPIERQKYWLSFAEWMAETTAKWLVTDDKPMSVVDRFFSAMARSIRLIRDTFAKFFGVDTSAPQALAGWLDSLITLEPLDYGALEAERNRRTQEANTRAMAATGHPDFPSTPQTPESGPSRRLLKMLKLLDHPRAREYLAATDRFNTFYKYMLSLVQVAARNLHIPGLQRYRELWQVKQLERANLMNVALETKEMWRNLKREESDNLAKMMDDYANGRFMSDAEAKAGVVRRPTPAEYDQMRKDHKITPKAWAVFLKVQQDFDFMLDEVMKVEMLEAQQISNPTLQAKVMVDIAEKFANYKKIPYMPFMRYGEWTVSVRDAAGTLVGFYTFETERKRDAEFKKIEFDLLPGETVSKGVLPEEVRPLIGLPPGLLDKIRDKLGLTRSQEEALEQLKFDFSPIQSFKRRFARRKFTPGYSLDFQRGYLNYFFFGSNYLTNVKYAQHLLDQIKEVRDSARPLADGTRRGRIANFMSDHYHFTMNAKPDWATFRQMATVWALGFSPAAATLNMSQMVVGSFPFLASKFGGIGVGDGRSMKALMKAGAQLSTYYKRGTFEGMTEQDMRGLNEGVKEGIITEALAHELAAAAEADNLKPYPITRARETFNWVVEKSMWMFEMTEQMNRRITFRAAWRLALEHPDMQYVGDAVDKHQLAYRRLREKGWAHNEAAAFVVAKDVVEETQFIYQQWASPRFMRGRLRTVFLFKSFVQNTLFMLWNNPGARARSLLIMAFLGGLMGMPGGEDLRGIIKMLAYRLFGKDFDIEEAARAFVIDVLEGKVPPDLILHGAARRGFGLPAAMDLVGVPFPTFDRSKAVSLGHILPIDFGVLGGPHRDTSRAIAESTQKAAGAAFGVGFNMYKFLTDTQLNWNDTKRWQLAMPRSMASVTRSFRYYAQGEEINRYGNRVVRFDVNDPRQLAEVIGSAMGYQPMRLAAQWDRIMAEREAITFWNIRREMLLRQLWSARGDPKQYEAMLQSIRNFNGSLPTHAALKRIDSQTIQRSFQARLRSQQAQESGIPRTRADVPIAREIQRLYPEAQVDVRTIR